MQDILATVPDEQHIHLAYMAFKKGVSLQDLYRGIFDAAVAADQKEPCTCWQQANEKLKPMGVQLSDKLLSLSPTKDLDLKVIHQLPTEPLGAGRFKASMPRYIGFPRCPFCGKSYESKKEAA